MKVLMLGWELPPHNSGGLGVACEQLCQSLTTKDLDLEFILPYEAEHQQPFTVTSALPYSVSFVQTSGLAYDSDTYRYSKTVFGDGFDLFTQQLQYERAVEEFGKTAEYDIIHAHDWLTFRAGLRLKMQSGKPLILHVHSIERDRAGGNAGNQLVREIEEISLNLADRVIAVSNHTKLAIHEEYGVPLETIEVVHNSISADKAMYADEAAETYRYLEQLRARGYKVVTNVGRITIQKGLTHLLRAMQLVVQREPRTMLLLVGSGEQTKELIVLAAELGIGTNVLFAGFQRGKAWRDAFRSADLFVMPSVSEPFGLTPLEATMFDTPSLISKQSGVAEVMMGALKVDYWDEHEMANQILAALQNAPLREALVETASREVARMSWQQAADKVFEIYQTHHKPREAALV